jgi:hypothetical protein
VRVRLRVSSLGLRTLPEMRKWLRERWGRRKYWFGPGNRMGVDDSAFVYVPSLDFAKAFVSTLKCVGLIECVPHPLPEVGDPVYDPDH